MLGRCLENMIDRGVAQLGKARALGARERRFKSCYPDQIFMKVQIYNEFGCDEIRIIIVDEETVKGVRRVHNFSTGTACDLERGKSVPAEYIMKIPGMMSAEFFQAFAEALAERGVRTHNDELNEGELKATKFHLKDLRTLLKLNHEKDQG